MQRLDFSFTTSISSSVQNFFLCGIILINTISFMLLDLKGIPFVNLGYHTERSYLPIIKFILGLTIFMVAGVIFYVANQKDKVSIEPKFTLSPHQKYRTLLYESGKCYEEMLKDWHHYYRNLNNFEKFEVWNEYKNHFNTARLTVS